MFLIFFISVIVPIGWFNSLADWMSFASAVQEFTVRDKLPIYSWNTIQLISHRIAYIIRFYLKSFMTHCSRIANRKIWQLIFVNVSSFSICYARRFLLKTANIA